MIKLSASSIKDFLSCPMKMHYRMTYSGQSIMSEEMIAGLIVHEIVEKYWDNKDKAFREVYTLINKYNLDSENMEGRIKICLSNFFRDFVLVLSEKDSIEQNFKVNYKGNNIVGRFDRVTKDGIIIDWKTSPKDNDRFLSSDIQFIIYKKAYELLYKKEPKSIWYVSLLKNKIFPFVNDTSYTREFWDVIYPETVSKINKKEFTRRGLFTGACHYCSYGVQCFKELKCLDGT